DLEAGRGYLTQSDRLTSGIVPDELAGLPIASHLALRSDRPDDGARLAGAAQQLAAEQRVTNVALAVLQIPDPITVAAERLPDRADGLVAEGRAMTKDGALALAREIAAPREGVATA